jgi:hypothetical protein
MPMRDRMAMTAGHPLKAGGAVRQTAAIMRVPWCARRD